MPFCDLDEIPETTPLTRIYPSYLSNCLLNSSSLQKLHAQVRGLNWRSANLKTVTKLFDYNRRLTRELEQKKTVWTNWKQTAVRNHHSRTTCYSFINNISYAICGNIFIHFS